MRCLLELLEKEELIEWHSWEAESDIMIMRRFEYEKLSRMTVIALLAECLKKGVITYSKGNNSRMMKVVNLRT
jgi:hypothetical protein